MDKFVEKIAESKFMDSLRKISEKLSKSPAFGALSGGMGATMGLLMIGAVIQIVCAIGSLAFGWEAGQPLYDAIYLPYKLTMGILGFFMCFSLAYNYSRKLKSGTPVQSGFVAIVCFFLVVSPPVTATLADGSTFDALNLGNMGTGGMFVAMIIGLASVRISKFVIDHNWTIKLPDIVPEGILNSFNAIIPAAVNIIIWYGLSLVISSVSGGALTLSTLITYALSIPIGYLVSPVGMILILFLNQVFWFFGIHGTGVIFTAIMIPYVTAYMTNAELAAAGMPLAFSSIFLYGANGCLGGAGNTLALVVMGLRSKSEKIRAVSKASIGPALFNINEPVVFGFPIMYNPILLIPFILCPIVCMLFLWAAYSLNLIGLPYVMILTTLPVLFANFITTMDWRNVVFWALMFPITWLVYYPFYKVYEKQCVAEEAEAALHAEAE